MNFDNKSLEEYEEFSEELQEENFKNEDDRDDFSFDALEDIRTEVIEDGGIDFDSIEDPMADEEIVEDGIIDFANLNDIDDENIKKR